MGPVLGCEAEGALKVLHPREGTSPPWPGLVWFLNFSSPLPSVFMCETTDDSMFCLPRPVRAGSHPTGVVF